MTHDELLQEITAYERRTCNSAQDDSTCVSLHPLAEALRAVVGIHKILLVKDYENDTDWYECQECSGNGFSAHYPCETIKIIEKELG